jgi:hypothetical protein
MATWIFILDDEVETDEAVRYRGLEQMFARFEAEDGE